MRFNSKKKLKTASRLLNVNFHGSWQKLINQTMEGAADGIDRVIGSGYDPAVARAVQACKKIFHDQKRSMQERVDAWDVLMERYVPNLVGKSKLH